jgi:hypothetical protein
MSITNKKWVWRRGGDSLTCSDAGVIGWEPRDDGWHATIGKGVIPISRNCLSRRDFPGRNQRSSGSTGSTVESRAAATLRSGSGHMTLDDVPGARDAVWLLTSSAGPCDRVRSNSRSTYVIHGETRWELCQSVDERHAERITSPPYGRQLPINRYSIPLTIWFESFCRRLPCDLPQRP